MLLTRLLIAFHLLKSHGLAHPLSPGKPLLKRAVLGAAETAQIVNEAEKVAEQGLYDIEGPAGLKGSEQQDLKMGAAVLDPRNRIDQANLGSGRRSKPIKVPVMATERRKSALKRPTASDQTQKIQPENPRKVSWSTDIPSEKFSKPMELPVTKTKPIRSALKSQTASDPAQKLKPKMKKVKYNNIDIDVPADFEDDHEVEPKKEASAPFGFIKSILNFFWPEENLNSSNARVHKFQEFEHEHEGGEKSDKNPEFQRKFQLPEYKEGEGWWEQLEKMKSCAAEKKTKIEGLIKDLLDGNFLEGENFIESNAGNKLFENDESELEFLVNSL
ncbi:hypothetical protein PTTG_27108 [Puccinia triticina 1-1 BBBD Race 1]|uniref:Uncharacterized protein n=1 Tax=Puccinia triticina (isolate 1-1 / race 1 (BBBD)) TaxID=630390 RepID=A0A180GPR4_PUCT1|nr:hypothetical protein PTTG_27108 [Puccinia triticina 1-1 BBBD Race 1]